jgi:hypothetical protein
VKSGSGMTARTASQQAKWSHLRTDSGKLPEQGRFIPTRPLPLGSKVVDWNLMAAFLEQPVWKSVAGPLACNKSHNRDIYAKSRR